MSRKPAIPVKLPIVGIDWAGLIPSMTAATWRLGQFDGSLRRLPNPDLLLTPLRTQEAVLSSRIEGTFATMSEVLQFEAGEIPAQESKRRDIEEILNYRRALNLALDDLQKRPFCLNLVLKLHKTLLAGVRGQNKSPGEFRRQQNYIGSPSGGEDTIRFTPPEWTLLHDALDNWEKYYHMDRPNPIVQLAVIHAQFEFLHPFLDGNGRLGRILIPIFLFNKGILSQPNFYLSEYIEQNRDEYIDRLNALGKYKQSWNEWCVFFLNAVAVQAERNTKKADAILALYEKLKRHFIERTESKFAVPLLDAVFRQPVFQASQIQWHDAPPSKQTLATLLRGLKDGGILTEHRVAQGRSGSIWVLKELIELTENRFEGPSDKPF
jgi:Fic family protein